MQTKGIGLHVRTEFVAPVDVRMMKEGAIFRTQQPVREISGRYLDFGQYETTLLGLICQASGIGTMAHALILIMGDTVQATKAFDEVIEPGVRRVSLIDTFNDEKIEAINVAGE
ncbi:MAG: hypothetical protein JSW35_00045 [Deltaproteobacteria bacterium]|nr:MAG: hypothetical protein JSW35_00045 [Deltaproteobacteria bacterium]